MEDRSLWEARIGSTLRDTWRLESLIGVGGMAAVYVGAQAIGRRDAIKILHPEVARSADLRARFEQEARLLSNFRHPGAVEVLFMGTTDDGAPFIVMELLDGESLSAHAKRIGDMSVDAMLRAVDEVLAVLAAAHEQNIIHRDIKLDNVFVLRNGHVKVLDFGIARIRNSPHAVQTRMGSMLGTLPYMPPEQIRGGEIDGRADLFAVGVMMFRILTKRRIHEANTDAEMLVKMSTEPAPPLASILPSAPASLCAVVDRALAFRQERRYPDARTMQRDVQALLRGESPPYAMEKLAAGDMPNALIPPAAAPSLMALGEAPTVRPPPPGGDAFRDAPTAAGGVAPAVIDATEPTAMAAVPAVTAVTSAPVPPSIPSATTPPSTVPEGRGSASIMYAPTMMANATDFVAPPRAPSPSEIQPPTPVPATATNTTGTFTPPPTANSVIQQAKPAKQARPFPLIPALIAGLLCIVLLFVGIAVLRSQDDGASGSSKNTANAAAGEDPDKTNEASSTSTSTPTKKRKGKRDWSKVKLDE